MAVTLQTKWFRIWLWLCLSFLMRTESFFFPSPTRQVPPVALKVKKISDHVEGDVGLSRRNACRVAISGGLISIVSVFPKPSIATDEYRPAKRPFAYRVDSTQPPTLIPINNAQKELDVLSKLGKGSGTDKAEIVIDTLNLNNVLNKAVFGTIDAVKSLAKGDRDESVSGHGFASFVCLGLPSETTSADIGLAKDLSTSILQARSKGETALGLAWCPLSAQASLDAYISNGDVRSLSASLEEKGVPQSIVTFHTPLLEIAKINGLKLLAMAPEKEDISTARTKGLQYVDPDRRTDYVVDPEGFIALSQDPRFRVYADRSLLKDYQPKKDGDSPGLFFAERILVHETAAGVAAKYAVSRPDSMVIVIAPTADLRFLQGINGRIARLCAFLNPEDNKVTENSVTTILLNPSAEDTLSKTKFLRLEIGTGPETLDYQSKVSDYLWFSFMPKVNMLTRLMNG